jgi:hypothetical protein
MKVFFGLGVGMHTVAIIPAFISSSPASYEAKKLVTLQSLLIFHQVTVHKGLEKFKRFFTFQASLHSNTTRRRANNIITE